MITEQDFKQISGALKILGKQHEAVKLVRAWMVQENVDSNMTAASPQLTSEQRQFWAGVAYAGEGYLKAWDAFLEGRQVAGPPSKPTRPMY